jgi:hypothetical protein
VFYDKVSHNVCINFVSSSNPPPFSPYHHAVHRFPSVQDDELFCLVRIPPNVLSAFSEANEIELELNPEKLEKVVTAGSARHEIPAQAVSRDNTNHIKHVCLCVC